MSAVKTAFNLIRNKPSAIVRACANRGLLSFLPDKMFLKLVYRAEMGKPLNLLNPETFSEKLQWLKLNDRQERYIQMVDKLAVRDIVKEKIGSRYLVPLIAKYNTVQEIEWAVLPQQFVMKCTHGSRCNIFCLDKSKLDIENAKTQLLKWMRMNWYAGGREWAYKYVNPRIIVEELLCEHDIDISAEQEFGNLTDYKFYCFHGEPKYCQVIGNRNTQETIDFFDADWNLQAFSGMHPPHRPFPHSKQIPEKPEHLKEMICISTILSQNSPYVRIDLYEVKGKIYFGEFTLYPLNGFGEIEPLEWSKKFASLI